MTRQTSFAAMLAGVVLAVGAGVVVLQVAAASPPDLGGPIVVTGVPTPSPSPDPASRSAATEPAASEPRPGRTPAASVTREERAQPVAPPPVRQGGDDDDDD